jgi:hypothetical protein
MRNMLTHMCVGIFLVSVSASFAEDIPLKGNENLMIRNITNPIVEITYKVDFTNPEAQKLYIAEANPPLNGQKRAEYSCEQHISRPLFELSEAAHQESIKKYSAGIKAINSAFDDLTAQAACDDQLQFTSFDYKVLYASPEVLSMGIYTHGKALGANGGRVCPVSGNYYQTYNLYNGKLITLRDIVSGDDYAAIKQSLVDSVPVTQSLSAYEIHVAVSFLSLEDALSFAALAKDKPSPEDLLYATQQYQNYKDSLWKNSFAITNDGVLIKDMDCGDENGKNITQLILNKKFIKDKTILNEIEAYRAR